jgi:hypothetical protein
VPCVMMLASKQGLHPSRFHGTLCPIAAIDKISRLSKGEHLGCPSDERRGQRAE